MACNFFICVASLEPSLTPLRSCHAVFISFYNLVTDFYEYGWGQSFHFAPRQKNETFRESIRRAEYVLASRIEVSGRVQPRFRMFDEDGLFLG